MFTEPAVNNVVGPALFGMGLKPVAHIASGFASSRARITALLRGGRVARLLALGVGAKDHWLDSQSSGSFQSPVSLCGRWVGTSGPPVICPVELQIGSVIKMLAYVAMRSRKLRHSWPAGVKSNAQAGSWKNSLSSRTSLLGTCLLLAAVLFSPTT